MEQPCFFLGRHTPLPLLSFPPEFVARETGKESSGYACNMSRKNRNFSSKEGVSAFENSLDDF